VTAPAQVWQNGPVRVTMPAPVADPIPADAFMPEPPDADDDTRANVVSPIRRRGLPTITISTPPRSSRYRP
jgi:hypothetical protein